MRAAKVDARKGAGLPVWEDTLSVARTMVSAAPPPLPPLLAAAVACGGVDGASAARRRPPLARRQLACSADSGSADADEELDEGLGLLNADEIREASSGQRAK